jgi:hypothetical protein
MRLRALLRRDVSQIENIHKKHFEKEFKIEELYNHHCSFLVEEDEKIISAGGIRTIMEATIVTDKDVEVSKRREALLMMLKTALDTTKNAGYSELHAFVQDDKWMQHLIRYGFQPTKGKSLVIGVG